MTVLLLIALFAAPEASTAAPPKAATTPTQEPAPAAVAPPVDVTSDTPPPSTWDKSQHTEKTGLFPAGEDTQSLAGQLIRSVLSLGLVVALIYALGKLVLAKMGRFRGASAGSIAISERLQVDAKNALFVVTVDGKQRLLVGGGGDKGLTLLATLDPAGQSASGATFKETLDKTASPETRGRAPEDEEEGSI